MSASWGGWRLRHDLDDVETYYLFLGHPRSGHSVVGALLDAHSQMIVSDELDALRFLQEGYGRRQLLHLSLAASRRQARNARRKQGRDGRQYSYAVEGQWQGRYDRLRVVGDSRAGWSVRRLSHDPALLKRIEQTMSPTHLRFIQVVRNPYDNIATMMIRGGRTFEGALDLYFANCRAIEELRGVIGPDRLFRVRHEDVIVRPRESIAALCEYLGVTADDGYLRSCAAMLYPRPSRSREEVGWSTDRTDLVAARSRDLDYLGEYTFDGQ